METETGAKVVALTLGYISGIHAQLHKLRASENLSEEDERDIDSAQVFLEGADWKLKDVLDRHQPTPNPAFWADVKSKSKNLSEED